MQSGGGTQQGHGGGGAAGVGGGHGRNAVSTSASPSSSSSAVSTPHPGFDQQQQLLQQQQQQLQRQLLQHQLQKKPVGNDAMYVHQAGGLHGFLGGGSLQAPQQSRKFLDMAQQQGSFHIREEGQGRNLGFEQQVLDPIQQAYLQYAFQAGQQKPAMGLQTQQQTKIGIIGHSGKDQGPRMGNLKMQELISIQGTNHSQASSSNKSSDHPMRVEKSSEQGQQAVSDPRNEAKPSNQAASLGQLMLSNMGRTQVPQSHQNIQNMTNSQLAMAAQMQAMQALALERNIDLSHPANANLVAQLVPLMQSRILAQQRANENNIGAPSSSGSMQKQQVTSPQVANESSPHGNSSSDVSGQSGSTKGRQTIFPCPLGATQNAAGINNSNIPVQQLPVHSQEKQLPPRQPLLISNAAEKQLPTRQPTMTSNGMLALNPSQTCVNLNQGTDHSLLAKNTITGPESLQMQYSNRNVSRASPQPIASPNDGSSGSPFTSHGGQMIRTKQQHVGFTKQQLHVLKAQILAFRRLKKGDGNLPRELLQAIAPPPLDMQLQQVSLPAGTVGQDRPAGKILEDHEKCPEPGEKELQAVTLSGGLNNPKEESFAGEGKLTTSGVNVQGITVPTKEPAPLPPPGKPEQQVAVFSAKAEHENDRGVQKSPVRSEIAMERGKAVSQQVAVSEPAQVKKPLPGTNASQSKDVGSVRKYHGPLFDFPFFTRKHDTFGSAMMASNNNNLTLAYDLKDVILEEGVEVLNKRRTHNLKKIGNLLAVNLERKRIRPDLVLRLQIEEKKLRLGDLQSRVREEVDQQQQEIMAMPDRPYRKFVRLCERQRLDLARQVQASQKAMKEKQLKAIFQWRKRLLESHWALRDARTARNRGVAKYHERMLREFSKRKDDDRNKRMEALKNNDVERYREMLLEQQTTSISGDAAERYAVLSSFLTQTEDYLHKLGGKITAAKNQQEAEEAANVAAAAARAQGLSEEEVRAAAACAGEEVKIRNHFSEMNAPKDSSSVNKYYNLAHAVNERVIRQPSMLRAGTLRDYQIVGLQWMLSLYNNKLNGILADEMGLGKTVQVMALIAYLMEFKGNYGPHLIIVPNAVLVNWKSELHNWLPTVSCIFYVGGKDQRSKLFSQEVAAMKFNVLVTTYEFIMYDRSKLSKVDWRYIIIDEAQRMKDRESVLARDLDRYRCQRRLLLTGTPLQNDLKELWSLLNLLLPEVFDNRKAFHDWFSKPFQKEDPTHSAEDDWLETEKKVIIIHRLHQILEPFMLRRRVEEVEGSLPPKVSIVLRCRMSAFQSAIYDWIKSTGTLRVDPEDEKRRAQKNPIYQPKTYRTLNNRCMELRKTCNHPLLNYPYFHDSSKDFLLRSCGKLWVLDRILIKLQRTGHRVLLFSTMTKLLDIMEEYLQWRRLVYRRIDGTTSLEERESAIVDFNSPDTSCFIFLLSIRAAGRGLNLQTADTVIIYDPDPNPKNEEQAVARAHRIGQKREVKVIYMEAVVGKITSHQREDEFCSGGVVDSEDDLAGKDRYMGSIESLIRNNIQQYKIDMADEVINAGRFDQRTTHEERRLTLETLLHDEERYQETVHDVPSLQEVNRMIARSQEEVVLFDQMDDELDWAGDMMRYDQVPMWLRAGTKEVETTITNMSKKPSKGILLGGNVGMEATEMASETERRRGRPKRKKFPIYTELDDENEELSEANSEERNDYSGHEEEGEIGDFEHEDYSGACEAPPGDKDQLDEDGPASANGYDYRRTSEFIANNHLLEEAGSSGSSSDSRILMQMVSPSLSSQKFGSLSALDSRPDSISKRLTDDLEEGEIAVSGDSHIDIQQSGSWIHDRDEGEDEQVLQPKIKRKRSIRLRPRHAAERSKDKSNEKLSFHRGDSSQLFQMDQKYDPQLRSESEHKVLVDASLKHDQIDSSLKTRRNLSSRKIPNMAKTHASLKSGRTTSMPSAPEETGEHLRGSWDSKIMNAGSASIGGTKMSDSIQRKCKNVISKLQRRLDKEGPQIVPLLTGLWKKLENSGYPSNSAGNNLLDPQKIDLRVDRFEYNGVMELVSDVQLMLKSAIQYYGFSHEVRSEARKVHDLFFDILKIAFPDTDFREARNAVSFSGPVDTSTCASSSRQVLGAQSKRHKHINEVKRDTSPPQKSVSRGHVTSFEDTKARSHTQKESRLGSSGSGREQVQQEVPQPFTHPGDLVICKKKRKDREKSVLKVGNGSSSPLSPSSIGRGIRSPGPISKDTRLGQQLSQQQGWANQSPQHMNGGGGGTVGWANPVKRMRTDAGKRRPSHI